MTFKRPTTTPTLTLSFDEVPQTTYVKVLLKGYPKGGKTFAALEMATAMSDGKPFPVINTEKNGIDFYRRQFPLAKVINLSSETGFNGLTYVQALDTAMSINPNVIVVDSLSPAWNGTSGVLDEAAASGKSDFYVWKTPKEKNKKLIEKLLELPVHVIATVRSKTKLVVNPDTKEVSKRAGAPIQNNEIEFEFDVNFDLKDGGIATVIGSRLDTLQAKMRFERNNAEIARLIGEGLQRING